MRASTFKSVVSVFTGVNSGSLTMNELAFNYIVPFLGKYQTLPVIYGARIEHEKSSVNIEFHEWISSQNKTSKQFIDNIEAIYSKALNYDQANALQKEMTIIFRNNSEAKGANTHNSQRFIRVVQLLKNTKYFSVFRPMSTIERNKWFLFLGRSVLREMVEIHKLRNFLKHDSILNTPNL